MDLTTAPSATLIARELFAIMPRLNRIIARQLRAEFGDDATIVQMRVLGTLDEAPLTLSALARKREVSLQAASEHVQSLVARGLVRRTPDPNDRRQQLLSLTAAGQRQLEQVRQHMGEQFSPIIGRMAAEDAESFYRGLLALHSLLQDEVPPTD